MEFSFANILPALFWMIILSLAAWHLPFFSRDAKEKKWFFGLFCLKVLVGIAVWAIYTYYYTDQQTSDIYRFFADSTVIYHALFEKPLHYWQLITGIGGSVEEHRAYYETMNNWYKSFDDGFVNENRTLIRFNALLMPFTYGSYFANMVITCFLGVWAQSFLYKQLRKRITNFAFGLFIIANLWPSQLFWTSALMKEPLVMIGIAISLGTAIKLKEKISASYVFLLGFGIWFTLLSKFYIGIALCFPLLAFLFSKERIAPYRILLNYGVSFLLLLLFTWGLGKLLPQFDIPYIISAKQHAFANVAATTKAGSAFYIPPLSPSLRSMLEMSPIGVFNSLFRPFPADADGIMEWFAVSENILFLLVLIIVTFSINPKSPHLSICVSMLMFGLIILVLGGITVNISGALVRYKMPAIPYIATAFFFASQLAKPLARSSN